MRTLHHKNEGGFIALISILIMSVVLLATTLSLAQFGIASRYFILDIENKAASEKLAEACVHIARIRVYNDPEYEVSTAIAERIFEDTCTIYSVEKNNTITTIESRATKGSAVTNLRVMVNNTNGKFTYWKEEPTF